MKSILAVLGFGSLALVVSLSIPVLNSWGPLVAAWTAVGLLLAWAVHAEGRNAGDEVQRKRAA